MNRERVTGWCITWDSDRLPNLQQCEVERVSEQRFLYPLGNDDDAVVEYVSLGFGESFFHERLSALVRYEHLLVEEIERLSRQVSDLVTDRVAAEDEISQLRKEADAKA